ncbi:16S rRNA (adenine(1518)-N(6)/adenine(1519)-N(6))-dimethyltransferase RsmA [uncultured Campylobacter sp.]|uniref:16S rRNA (adenine(1518)-N(6)/adenine(1519)-N(6))- dimethyltransferase RsmA n=1 Tax=uncultured Campylobacter sp. TaxID=218934 RepID=UPI0026099A87|nr:16S rRNA (adenine(1518)-N(6)/adenine(1519)-N(6))-dimethyltransferase RsmA [uncultured Campylobacter sp.]
MIRAKKEFGQNFLKDEAVLNKIIQAIPENVQNVVEIGAGLGDLTRKLLEFYRLKSFEIDEDLYQILSAKFAQQIASGELELVLGDALRIWQERGLERGEYFLVANLPYYVATKMILQAIDDELCSGFLVMIQKEVALKFCAKAGQSDFSALSILADLAGGCELLFNVEPDCFEPAPKVTSSVMRLLKRRNFRGVHFALHPEAGINDRDAKMRGKPQSPDEYERFKSFLRVSFSAPRKTLIKNLSAKFDRGLAEEIFLNLKIPPTVRAHELNSTLFLEIFKNLKVKDGRKQK